MKSCNLLFNDIVVPLLYTSNDESLWKINSKSIIALNTSLAKEFTGSNISTNKAKLLNPISFTKKSIILLAGGAGGKSLTYGEVLPSSIEQHVIPQLNLVNGDVVFDLGSGTGKIPLQIAFYSYFNGINVKCKGIELSHERHMYAEQAYQRLLQVPLQELSDHMFSKSFYKDTETVHSESHLLLNAFQDIANRVEAIEGDLLFANLSDVTVIFVNNTVFDPALMIKLSHLLADRSKAPKLRKLVMLRPLCYRHTSKCEKLNSACCAFEHPAQVTICNSTWCKETTLFTYTVNQAWTLSKRWTFDIDTYSSYLKKFVRPQKHQHENQDENQDDLSSSSSSLSSSSLSSSTFTFLTELEKGKRKLSISEEDLIHEERKKMDLKY